MTSKEFLLLKTELEYIKKQNEIIIKDFTQKFKIIENEIEKLQKQNENFKQKLNEVSEKRSEQYYQRYLEKLLSASHQKTKHGKTDITTDTQIIEIKHWKNYKNALGQLFSYKDFQKNKNKCLAVYFFGYCSNSQKETIVQLFQQNEISVYEFIDTEDGVKVNQIYSQLPEEVKVRSKNSRISNWLDENIIKHDESIVNLKDICNLCFGKELNKREKGKVRKEVETWLKQKFPELDFICKESRFNGCKYNGWKGISLKD